MTADIVPIGHTPRTVPRLEPGSDEYRIQPYVSASTAGALYGQHPFLDLRKLAAIKRDEVDDTAGEAAETGHVVEDAIANWWGDSHGVALTKPTVSYIYGPLSASPDRLIVGSTSDLLEVKATGKSEGPMPPYWWYQAQAQMACTGAERVHFAVLWGEDLLLREYPVGRDEVAIADMVERAHQFLEYVQLGIDPPEPAARPATEEVVAVGDGEATLLAELAAWRAAERDAKKEADTIKRRLEAILGTPGLEIGSRLSLVHNGRPVAKLRIQRGREKTVGTGEYGAPFAVFGGE